MEVKFDVVRPNLIIKEDEVYFAVDSSDVVPASRAIDEVVEKHIGTLKVRECDLEVMRTGKGSGVMDFIPPLKEYLDTLSDRQQRNNGEIEKISDENRMLFGLDHIIRARTHAQVKEWIKLERFLSDPDKTFKECEADNPYLILNREKTLEQARKLHSELEPKTPGNCAIYILLEGMVERPVYMPKYVGAVEVSPLKTKGKTKVEEAKSELVDKLKEFNGPALSLDAPNIHLQMWKAYCDARTLVNYATS